LARAGAKDDWWREFTKADELEYPLSRPIDALLALEFSVPDHSHLVPPGARRRSCLEKPEGNRDRCYADTIGGDWGSVAFKEIARFSNQGAADLPSRN
jgi:hypothetical protein